MCFYRYSYYSRCRHPELVLVAFCERATAVESSDAPALATFTPVEEVTESEQAQMCKHGALTAPSPTHNQQQCHVLSKKMQERWREQQKQRREQQQTRRASPPSSSEESFYTAAEYLHNTSTFPPPPSIGSASVTDEPVLELISTSSSSIPEHQQHSSTPSTSSDESMAGLKPFGATWRNFMALGAGKQADHESRPQGLTPPLTARRQEPGIRENTDESFDLPKSSDILRHIAESARDVYMDGHRLNSFGSIGSDKENEGERRADRDSFEDIEHDIDALKEEIRRLKQQDTKQREQDADRHCQAAPSHEPEGDSPATRLMKRYKQEQKNVLQNTVGKSKTQAPPSPMDFPALSGKKSGGTLAGNTKQQAKSYASAATTGTRSKRADSKIPAPVYKPRHSMESNTDSETTVVITSGNNEQSSPSKSSTLTPRFAQPTQSVARRADETLRKDSKVDCETSPAKSIRSSAPNFETDKRAAQRHNKRTSLPDAWVSAGSSSSHSSPTKSAASSTPTTLVSPTSDSSWPMVNNDGASQASAAPKAAIQQSPQLRKKTSTYMMPTSSATNRHIATLGEDGARRSSSIKKIKSGFLKLDTERANQFGSQASPESIVIYSSGSSEPPTAVERLAASVGMTPQPPTPPMKQAQGTTVAPAIDAVLSRPSVLSAVNTKSAMSPSTPNKLTRARRNTIQQPAAASSRTENAAPAPLDAVANTRTRRRTSRADILQPILDKLDSQGLNKAKPEPATLRAFESPSPAKPVKEVIGMKSRLESAEHAVTTARDVIEKHTGRKAGPDLSNIALLARQGNAGKKIVVPPHLKKKQSVLAKPEVPSADCTVVSSTTGHAVDGAVFTTTDTSLLGIPDRPSSVASSKSTPASSLRATALEFTPMWKPQNKAQELSLLSWQGTLDYPPEEVWSRMPPNVRDSINVLRDYKRYGTSASPATAPQSASSSPSKRAEQRFWGSLMKDEEAAQVQTAFNTMAEYNAASESLDIQMTGMKCSDIVAASTVQKSRAFKTVSPNSVQAGQVLKPALSPGKKSVQWVLQDTDGKDRPINFGRAPSPPLASVDVYDERTPSISPTSDDTSPWKTPFCDGNRAANHAVNRAWTIGSGFRAQPYGWKGGDGREISFSGWGPHAETNPNNPVHIFFGGSPAVDKKRFGPAGKPSPGPKVFPRSRKQWAEFVGYEKAPCGDMEFVAAAEHLPTKAFPSFGWCNGCVPSEIKG